MNKRALIAYTPLIGLVLIGIGSIVFRNEIMARYRESQMNKYRTLLSGKDGVNEGIDDKIVPSSDRGAWFARYQEYRDMLVEAGTYDKLEWEIDYLRDRFDARSKARRKDFLARLDKATNGYKHRALNKNGQVQVFIRKAESDAMFKLVDKEITNFIDEVVSNAAPIEELKSPDGETYIPPN